MIKKNFTFKDGTKISYREKKEYTQRIIEYPLPKSEIEFNKKIGSSDRYYPEIVCEKKYYLQQLKNMTSHLDNTERIYFCTDFEKFYNNVGEEYEDSVLNLIPDLVIKYTKGNEYHNMIIFILIYLAMLDMEEIKNNYTNPLGKKIVLDSCKAVVLDNKSVEEAVNMFKSDRKDNRLIDNDDDNIHSYEKYGGYNDFDDDTIDDAFEGYPELTWNVD